VSYCCFQKSQEEEEEEEETEPPQLEDMKRVHCRRQLLERYMDEPYFKVS
jgi:hypothetical protein